MSGWRVQGWSGVIREFLLMEELNVLVDRAERLESKTTFDIAHFFPSSRKVSPKMCERIFFVIADPR